MSTNSPCPPFTLDLGGESMTVDLGDASPRLRRDAIRALNSRRNHEQLLEIVRAERARRKQPKVVA